MAYRQKHPYIAQIYYMLKFTAAEKLSKLVKRKGKGTGGKERK